VHNFLTVEEKLCHRNPLLTLKDGFLTLILLVVFHSLGKYFLIETSAEQLIHSNNRQKLLSQTGTTFTFLSPEIIV
jgi:hypothetical protein